MREDLPSPRGTPLSPSSSSSRFGLSVFGRCGGGFTAWGQTSSGWTVMRNGSDVLTLTPTSKRNVFLKRKLGFLSRNFFTVERKFLSGKGLVKVNTPTNSKTYRDRIVG